MKTEIFKIKFRFLLLLAVIMPIQIYSQKDTSFFKIRGTLPWHNFLSGPTSWNLIDYISYLDELQKENINFIGFHNYTGGGERYAGYVEPMIKIQYKNILPQAFFDNSLTGRWGYAPMRISDFAYQSACAFLLYKPNDAFGADCSIKAVNNEDRYKRAQELMKQVMIEAHKRGIQFAMGFEFGVHPPEYYSLSTGSDFYWPAASGMVPNPTHYESIEILHATLDNIIETYPGIDYIWLWLNEHSFMGVNTSEALRSPSFKLVFEKDEVYFKDPGSDQSTKFIGVWALEYIRLTRDYLNKKGCKAKIIIGGWGGGNQLPSILKGLDRALPNEIIFSLLNPDLGKSNPPDFLEGIARKRKVIPVSWLEGDDALWALQPRVELLKNQVKFAQKMNAYGVIAIHWRREETRLNLESFAHFAYHPFDQVSTREIYYGYLRELLGAQSASFLSGEFTGIDTTMLDPGSSPEFYAYTPKWGRLNPETAFKFKYIIDKIDKLRADSINEIILRNLKWFKSKLSCALLLNEIGKRIEPGWEIRTRYLSFKENPGKEKLDSAIELLQAAPIKEFFDIYTSSVRSRGEMGELSSMNQKLWHEFQELKKFLTTLQIELNPPKK
jgi:hypothetical protein